MRFHDWQDALGSAIGFVIILGIAALAIWLLRTGAVALFRWIVKS